MPTVVRASTRHRPNEGLMLLTAFSQVPPSRRSAQWWCAAAAAPEVCAGALLSRGGSSPELCPPPRHRRLHDRPWALVMSEPVVAIDGLWKQFGDVSAVEDLSFTVERGRGVRSPRSERRGEDHDATCAARAGTSVTGGGTSVRFDGPPGLPGAGPARSAGRGGGIRAPLVWDDQPPVVVGGRRRSAARRRHGWRPRDRRLGRCHPPQGPHVLAGHEAASRLRPAAVGPAGAAGAGRADERPGSR